MSTETAASDLPASVAALHRASRLDDTHVAIGPDVLEADRHRRAARIVLVDRDRVLLEHVRIVGDPAQGRWWELPGGGMDPGESSAEAAARELTEETGYLDVAVGPPVATLRIRYRTHRHTVEQHETIHVGRLRSPRRVPPRPEPAEVDGLIEVAWCTPDEVADGRRLVLPELAALARDAVEGRLVPRELGTVDVTGWSDAAPDPVVVATDAGPRILPATVSRPSLVVRDAAPWTPALHAWLAHLRGAGVTRVPVPYGVDRHGRAAVSFVEGETTDAGTGRFAAALRGTAGLHAVGSLLAAIRA
ncbi:MAG: NUDIX domain-containing protein, partial [Nitriliruptoraceae bacterium]|nr:NUDIX domain-containing protein [Nitriliruptoraceae bacterium]